MKGWMERNREKQREYHRNYHKEYYRKNKGKIDAKNTLYARTHRKEVVRNVQRYVSKHQEKVRTYNKEFWNTPRGSYRSILNRSKRWDDAVISLDEFVEIISNPCTYCGEDEKRIGVDRADNSRGYSIENSVPCCANCNYMKKTLTREDFLSHIEKIFNHNH